MKKNISDMLKNAVSFVASAGVTIIVDEAVKHVIPVNKNILKKICVGVGSVTLSYMIGDKVSEYVGKEIDSIQEEIKKNQEEMEEKDSG